MKVNEKIQKLFINFLSNQGITIEFKLEMNGVGNSIDDYMELAYDMEMDGKYLIREAFSWKDASHLDHKTWEYHNHLWGQVLGEAIKNGEV